MKLIAILSIVIAIFFAIKYYDLYNKHHKLRDRLIALNIPYEHYSKLLKSYTEFYKWLNDLMNKSYNYDIFTIKTILDKFNELFKEI